MSLTGRQIDAMVASMTTQEIEKMLENRPEFMIIARDAKGKFTTATEVVRDEPGDEDRIAAYAIVVVAVIFGLIGGVGVGWVLFA